MVTLTAADRASGCPPDNRFEILEDQDHNSSLLDEPCPPIGAEYDVLGELDVDACQNQNQIASVAMDKLQVAPPIEPKSLKVNLSPRGPRSRPSIDPETFAPLEAVHEEAGSVSGAEVVAVAHHASTVQRPGAVAISPGSQDESHLLIEADPIRPLVEQVQKHLAGQFEWLITLPTTAAGFTNNHAISRGTRDKNNSREKKGLVLGCNLLRRRRRSASKSSKYGCALANNYLFLATPLEAAQFQSIPEPHVTQNLSKQIEIEMATGQNIPAVDVQLKLPSSLEVVEFAEGAWSPSLTMVSERSGSFAGNSSRTGSFSVPRIEDSLAELDKLEDELEAVNAVTQPGHIPLPDYEQSQAAHGLPQSAKKSGSAKRVTIAAGPYATVRAKPTQKVAKPALRRSSSLTFRDPKEPAQTPISDRNTANSAGRPKPTAPRTAEARTPIKSSKPPTVPSFELPGEAVARRLKEQREARQAQQAEAKKIAATPARSKSTKPLARPTFELPGEAISRRKREEREAKLKAQEDEEKRRREFKARPFKQSSAPMNLPRETVASRARQGKVVTESTDTVRTKRMSMNDGALLDNTSTLATSSLVRGRHSMILPMETTSRGTSTSTGSMSGKHSNLSANDVAQQRVRGQEIYTRDNSYCQDRQREKREREESLRIAREQAAERSRAASREWAEKQRRKLLAHKEEVKARAAAGLST